MVKAELDNFHQSQGDADTSAANPYKYGLLSLLPELHLTTEGWFKALSKKEQFGYIHPHIITSFNYNPGETVWQMTPAFKSCKTWLSNNFMSVPLDMSGPIPQAYEESVERTRLLYLCLDGMLNIVAASINIKFQALTTDLKDKTHNSDQFRLDTVRRMKRLLGVVGVLESLPASEGPDAWVWEARTEEYLNARNWQSNWRS
ncbi:hypothetical protein B0J14DRAFT_558926 [Halenospora varia]|nr:hypothetical protein B0J14DRAFT_558926 [Halenospora varia]